MESYDLVLHFGEQSSVLVDIVKGAYTYEHLIYDVHRWGRMPRIDDGLVGTLIFADVEDPPERISVKNDVDMMVMFERNHALKEVHLYIEFEIVKTVVVIQGTHEDFWNNMDTEDSLDEIDVEDDAAGHEGATTNDDESHDAGKNNRDKDVEPAVENDVDLEDLGGDEGTNEEPVDIEVDSGESDDAVDEEILEEDVLLTKGDDLLSDYGSFDGIGRLLSSSSDDELHSDDGCDFHYGAKDQMSSFMDREYFEQPEDHYERVQFRANVTLFEDVSACRNAVRDFAIREGFILEKIKSDKLRCTMRCKADGCPWRFHASRVSDGATFNLKTYTDHHTCCRTELSAVSAEWISYKILPTLKGNPEVSTKQLRTIIQGFGIKVRYMQIWRARQKAMIKLDGDHGTTFHKLPYYCRMLDNCMQHSHCILQFEMVVDAEATTSVDIPHVPHFKRVFIGLAPLREGFLAGCAPWFGLDGCHLKGTFGGVLLSAVSLDGDNGIYPICWAVVEAETRDSWVFFLRHMEQFLGGFGEEKPWTIMTDRQKGLIQAISEVIPHAINRKCAKHIFQNMAKLYAAKKLRMDFWGAARSYTEVQFWVHMEKIKDKNPRAYDWLMRIDPKLWSRHAFDTRLKNNHITNNITESFNAWIAVVRHKPIMALLEGLRKNVMTRLQDRNLNAQEWSQPIMPNILQKINKNMAAARKLDISHSSSSLLEVSDLTGNSIVNLAEKSCDCRYWEVTGWPCKHACKAIQYMRLHDNMSQYVDPQFLRTEFLKTYAYSISPVSSKNKWNYNQMSDVTPKELRPPPFRRLPGRPRVKRKRDADEDNPKRSSDGVTCSRCGQTGHNKRTCEVGAVGTGRSRRRRTYETSTIQEPKIDSDEPLGSYVQRSQRMRRNDMDAVDQEDDVSGTGAHSHNA